MFIKPNKRLAEGIVNYLAHQQKKVVFSISKHSLLLYGCRNQSSVKLKNYFAFKKPDQPSLKQQNLTSKSENQQFLWKVSTLSNVVGIVAGFFMPNEALLFVLTSNSIIQIYLAGNFMDEFKNSVEKANEGTAQSRTRLTIFKSRTYLQKAFTSLMMASVQSAMMGISLIEPLFFQYSLVTLDGWIFFNIFFNRISSGFYVALLSLLGFQYFVFQKKFESNTNSKFGQRI